MAGAAHRPIYPGMTQLLRPPLAAAVLAAAIAAASPASAQTAKPSDPEVLQRELEALSDEARRALEEALARLGPIIQNMISMIDGLLVYDAPRVLPNGDILIPRRRDAPPPAGDDSGDGETPDTLEL